MHEILQEPALSSKMHVSLVNNLSLDDSSRELASFHGRNRAIVIAEPLPRVIAAIRTIGVRWRMCIRCVAIRIAQLAFVRVTFVPRGIAEWLVRVDSVR